MNEVGRQYFFNTRFVAPQSQANQPLQVFSTPAALDSVQLILSQNELRYFANGVPELLAGTAALFEYSVTTNHATMATEWVDDLAKALAFRPTKRYTCILLKEVMQAINEFRTLKR